MKEGPVFLISFVKLVEKHPCLWNYTLKEYSMRNVVDAAWRTIAAEVHDTEANCRDRWKNIRCAFVRSQKYAGKFKKQYYLADHLAFLLPYTKRKVGSAKVSTEFSTVEHHEYCLTNDGDVNKSEDRKVTLELTLSDDNEHNSDSLTATPIEKDVITKKRKVISQLENEADGGSFVKWVNATQNNQNKTKEEDADLLFLRSLLPEVKRLSDKKKRTFKRKVLTLLDELLDDA